MRDPENRRGVPLRAGVGIATVAATVAAGIALASPASATVTAATQTPASASAYTGTTQTFTQKYTASSGDTAVIELSQAVSATTPTRTNPLTVTIGGDVVAGSTPTDSWSAAGTTYYYDDTVTFSAANPTVTVTVKSDTAGTVSVVGGAAGNAATGRTASDGSTPATPTTPSNTVRTPTSTLTVVAKSGSGVDFDVQKLTVTPTSLKAYDTESPYNFVVTATGASGLAVPGAAVKSQITVAGSTPVAGPGGTTALDANGNATVTIPVSAAQLGGSPSTASIVFYVNNATTGSITAGLDAGDTQTAAVPATVDKAPTYTVVSLTSSNDATKLPQGSAASVTYTVTVKNGATPVSGVKVAVDVQPSASSTTTRYPATTGSDGTATVNVPVTAADAQGNLKATAYVSEQSATGTGDSATKQTDNNVQFAVPTPYVDVPATVQAVPGSTVTVPVTVKDQFGNSTAANGDTLSYTITGRNTTTPANTHTVVVSNGTANLTYTDTGSGTTGTDTVTVTDVTHPDYTTAANNGGHANAATVEYVTSVTPYKIDFAGNPPTGTTAPVSSGPAETYTVTLTNSAGEVLKNTPITFSVNQGFVGDHSGPAVTAANSKSTVTINTDGSGQATIDVGSEKAGDQTITATAGSITQAGAFPITYTALAQAYNVSVTPATQTIAPNGQGTVTVKVTDKYGNAPIATGGAFPSVTLTDSGPAAFQSGVSPQTVQVGADGTVTVTLKAGTATGAGTVTATTSVPATAASDASVPLAGTATSNYTVGTTGPATMRVIVGHGRALQLEMIDALPLDSNGKRLGAGVAIRFRVSGAATLTATATTNRYGYAQIRFIPPRSGYLTATATTGSVSGTGSAYIKAPIERPTLSAASRVPGIIHVVVYSHPRQPYSSFILYKSAGHRYISAGTFKANKYGATRVNLTVRKGATLYLRALGTNRHYVEYYSNVVRIKAAG